ncbi:6,7-dimethyl-8-ribityllumazine synthase [Arthrobacter sp. ISL-5]|uniref:6,7-dimethyl-8-ribityllumazine synthase n=1 Tax=Arthrobacter sp. ISL-5 TaxID=2819111 RepID=UPI001BE6D26F|nr:6,7-dimethyl-8-ribityllumazine synthase [Arthrobacter sp. ISL-5]MBT2552527.1 6,7-dimethyl-8-ribityllumazine synthase [Arthrobacter sp. ISL-5]
MTSQRKELTLSPLATSSFRVAIVSARWHADIVDRAVDSFQTRLKELGIVNVDVHQVPGAFEIPLLVRRLAASGRYDGVATSALVVDGGIYRHEFVAQSVVDALMRVQLETDVPVFSGVLTPHHFHEHEEHRNQFSQHFVTKGKELADALASTLASLAAL